MSLTTFSVTVNSTEQQHRYQATSGSNFSIIFDAPRTQGGTNTGVTPNEGLLEALGACESVVAGTFHRSHHFDFSSLYLAITGTHNSSRPGFDEIHFTTHFRSPSTKSEITDFADFMDKTCPVHDNLTNAVPIKTVGIKVVK